MNSYKSLANQHAQLLFRWRWFILLVGLVGTLSIEFYEHGQDWLDQTFWVESGFYGLVIPVGIWLTLTWWAHSLAHQAKDESHLARHRRLRQLLTKYQDWTELANFIAEFPATFLALDHVALFIYDHQQAEFVLTAEWGLPSAESTSFNHRHPCARCVAVPSQKLHPSTSAGRQRASYCLPLFHEHLLVGVMRLHCSAGHALTLEQMEFLNATAPEVASALIVGMAYPRQIAQARSEAQLAERRQLAYLLHNSLAQQIGYLHLSLDRLAADPLLKASLQVELDHMRKASGEAYELTRSLLLSLQTGDQVNLSRLIHVQAQQVTQRSGLHLTYVTEGEPGLLEPQLCQDLLSLMREGLHNIEKHAHAQQVRLMLRSTPTSVSLELMDDGRGFDLTHLPQAGHYGLAMMHERVEAWRGEFHVMSAPGAGTTVGFQIPLPVLAAHPLEPAPTRREILA